MVRSLIRTDRYGEVRAREKAADTQTKICLRVEGGMLMAFGPDGDPVPSVLLAALHEETAGSSFVTEDGQRVDSFRALQVFDAQQKGRLGKRPCDRWIEAMLGVTSAFEETPADLLALEPDGSFPSLPEDLSD